MFSVLVIDDSPSYRQILKDLINKIEDFEVIDTAVDAYDAREKIKLYEPDLVTIDINMPKMDGVKFLRNLMRLHPMPAVVISGVNAKKSDIFEDGAVGFIEKQKVGESIEDFYNRLKDTLLNLTFLLKRYTLKKPKPKVEIKKTTYKTNSLFDENGIERKVHPDEVLPKKPAILPGPRVIGIGSSTGGVESLMRVFKDLEPNLPPIVITQHIPYGFSKSFAMRLNNESKINVKEASDGDILENNWAYVAPGNMHLTLEKHDKTYKIKLLDTVKVSRHKPSVDIMFRSINNTVGSSAMAIIMTGMGDDGAICMKELYDNGAYTVAQDEKSCVVFGMPKQAIAAGAIRVVVPLEEIATVIKEFAKGIKRN